MNSPNFPSNKFEVKFKDDPLFIRSRITEPPEGPTLIKSKFVLTMNYITFDSQNNSEGERFFFSHGSACIV